MELFSRERIHRVIIVLVAVLVLADATYARHAKKAKEARTKHHQRPDLKCKESKKTREKQEELAKG